jgi:hypothetical protein
MIISPYATQLTRDISRGSRNPERNMLNRKPYRTPSQKRTARTMAKKGEDGAFHSPSPFSMHSLSGMRTVAE